MSNQALRLKETLIAKDVDNWALCDWLAHVRVHLVA